MTTESGSQGGIGAPQECAGVSASDALELHQAQLDPDQISPLIHQDNFEEFQAVADAFVEAERRVKLVEWMDGTDVPSINELRYVSYHLLKACQIQDDPRAQYEELKRAERHCKRASFDAIELGIIGALEQVNDFNKDYNKFPISEVLPNYLDMMNTVEGVRVFLANEAGGEFRDDYYSDCEDRYSQLTDIIGRLRSARDEINKKRDLAQCLSQRLFRTEMVALASFTMVVIMFLFGSSGVINSEAEDSKVDKKVVTSPKDKTSKPNQLGTKNDEKLKQ